MKNVYILSGISGSGKSTWSENYLNAHEGVAYLSSDVIRRDDPTLTDPEVFKVLGDDYTKALTSKNINEIIIDTTALSHRRRVNFKRKNANLIVVLFITPFNTARDRILKRANEAGLSTDRKVYVPENALLLQLKALQPPIIGLDCDEFIIASGGYFDRRHLKKLKSQAPIDLTLSLFRNVNDFIALLKPEILENELKGINLPHNSSYHLEAIDTHINLTLRNSNSVDLKTIALFHDLGKPLFRDDSNTFSSFKGHEKFGALLYLDLLSQISGEKDFRMKYNDTLMMSIYLHMLPFKNLTPKQIRKYAINKEILNNIFEFHLIDKQSSIRS